MAWLVIGGGVILIVVAVLISRTRVPHDGVDNFRRQIDALSPEARRPTVGRVDEARHKRIDDDGNTRRPVSSVTPARGVDRRPADDSHVNPRPSDADAADADQAAETAPNATPDGPDHTGGSGQPGSTGEVPENPDSGGGSFDGT